MLREPDVLEIGFSTGEINEYVELIESATILGGWDSLAVETDAAVRDSQAGDEPQPDLERDARLTAFIREYFRAYFRNGRFYKATINTRDLRAEVTNRLREDVPFLEPETANDLVEEIFAGLNFDSNDERVLFGRIGADGFVSRGGEAHQFPAVEAKLSVGNSVDASVSDVDFVAVGSDLVRVLLHAVFDSHQGLPGVSEATGVGICLERGSGGDCLKPGLVSNNPDQTNVDATEFELVENWAGKVEGTTSAGLGRVVRGASWLSLNNEALASLIETAVGVTLRKAAERFAWCWYACGLNSDAPGADALGDYAVFGGNGNRLKIRLTIATPTPLSVN